MIKNLKFFDVSSKDIFYNDILVVTSSNICIFFFYWTEWVVQKIARSVTNNYTYNIIQVYDFILQII